MINGECRACGGRFCREHNATERMFGLGGCFPYGECGVCGSLSLLRVPENLRDYYPPHYYSLVQSPVRVPPLRSELRKWVRDKRNEAQLFRRKGFWGVVARMRSARSLDLLVKRLSMVSHGSLSMKILDVGCGGGELLRSMREAGFMRLVGLDPYASEFSAPDGSLVIRDSPLAQLGMRDFDLVMFHHSLEHMDAPRSTLRLVAELLGPEGECLLRVPLADSQLWRAYGTCWAELDAPRHVWVPTRKAIDILARGAGLEVAAVEYDSSASQHWVTDLYRRGEPYYDVLGQTLRRMEEECSAEECERYQQLADRDNENARGSRGAFLLRRGKPAA